MAKKPFSEKKLQAALAKARAEGKPPRIGAIALFETMETRDETARRELLEAKAEEKPVPSPKRRSVPVAVSKPKASVSKPKPSAKK